MRLHVAAQPFPSHQGTQAVIAAMVSCEQSHGIANALATYPLAESRRRSAEAGRGQARPAGPQGVGVHRPRTLPWLSEPSLRSGPSIQKILLDLQLVTHLRRLVARLRPEVIIAHHVEAALASLVCGGAPVVFFAHTDMQAELPCYGPPIMHGPLGWAGRLLDLQLSNRAHGVATISPWLAARLSRPGRDACFVSPPFPGPAVRVDRSSARSHLKLPADVPLVAYAGNLDAYQGVDRLPAMLQRLIRTVPQARLLIATESEHGALARAFERAGLSGHVGFAPLAGEQHRATVHGAADVMVVPRLAPGGLPIKLLDALQRGRPVVATPAAMAGLPLGGACMGAQLGAPMGDAVAALLLDAGLSRRMSIAGPCYMSDYHSDLTYVQSMGEVIAKAASGPVRPFAFM